MANLGVSGFSEEAEHGQRWRKGNENRTADGLKRYFACSHQNCAAKLRACYDSTSSKVAVSRDSTEHQHSHEASTNHGLSSVAKEVSISWKSSFCCDKQLSVHVQLQCFLFSPSNYCMFF